MLDLYSILRPALWRLPEETAHKLALLALRRGLARFVADPAACESDAPQLSQTVFGLTFPNPVGLAAGFDKDAVAPDALLRWFGFGFVEVGTVTPQPQSGYPLPRVFRLAEDQAVINRMGFPSLGLEAAVALLSRRNRVGIVGVNVGRNRESTDAIADYAEGVRRAAPVADYLVVNISSPNTPGLRDLQRRAPLEALLSSLIELRREAGAKPPLMVKIAPDLTPQEREDIAAVALSTGIDGIIVANTTVTRSADLRSAEANREGGLSGRPLFALSTELLADLYRLTDGRLPLIGVGGIASAEDAYAKICAGASLVQIHTGFVFNKNLVGEIRTGLVRLLRRDGFASLAGAVGSKYRPRSVAGGGAGPRLGAIPSAEAAD